MNLNNMTVTELRKLAARHNVTGRSTMKKVELIAALSAPEIADLVELTVTVDQMEETPAPASDHNPDTAGQVAAVDLSVLPVLMDTKPQRVYSVPREGVRLDVDHYASRAATIDVYTNEAGLDRILYASKKGRVWEMTIAKEGAPTVVRALSLNKLVKRWAKKTGIWAQITITRTY